MSSIGWASPPDVADALRPFVALSTSHQTVVARYSALKTSEVASEAVFFYSLDDTLYGSVGGDQWVFRARDNILVRHDISNNSGLTKEGPLAFPTDCNVDSIFPGVVLRDFSRRPELVESITQLANGNTRINARVQGGRCFGVEDAKRFPELTCELDISPDGNVVRQLWQNPREKIETVYNYSVDSPKGFGVVRSYLPGVELVSIELFDTPPDWCTDPAKLDAMSSELRAKVAIKIASVIAKREAPQTAVNPLSSAPVQSVSPDAIVGTTKWRAPLLSLGAIILVVALYAWRKNRA